MLSRIVVLAYFGNSLLFYIFFIFDSSIYFYPFAFEGLYFSKEDLSYGQLFLNHVSRTGTRRQQPGGIQKS